VSRLRIWAVALAFVGSIYAPAYPVLAEGAQFRVIVNPENPVVAVDRRFLADAFFKKTTRWPDDEAMRPVDLAPGASARRAFSEEVLKRSISAVKSYWQQMVFSGHGVPPAELDNEAEVVKFVLKNRGAVGYVSPGTNTAAVKVLTVR
jgi:ABC-type phosphate transport system substrate-binding protein